MKAECASSATDCLCFYLCLRCGSTALCCSLSSSQKWRELEPTGAWTTRGRRLHQSHWARYSNASLQP